jgi:perosamine synthetase
LSNSGLTNSFPSAQGAARYQVPLSVPELSGSEESYLKQCLETGWISSAGPFVERFEGRVAEYTGSPHAVALINGTSALHLGLLVAGVASEDEVIVSNLTFIAPVHAIRYCNAHPVLIDADPNTWQMDVCKLRQFLNERCEVIKGTCINKKSKRRVRAILPVHILGSSCQMERIVELAREYHLFVIEDAAEGLGTRYLKRHVGTWGDAGIYSFNGNKVVTCGGGGILVTSRSDWARRARHLITQARVDPVEYTHDEVGYNYRLTNIHAALGLAQMEQLDGFIGRKRDIANVYDRALKGIEGLALSPRTRVVDSTFWLYTVLLPKTFDLARRRAVIRKLRQEGVEARPFWCPVHQQLPYHTCEAYQIEHSNDLHARGVCLPSSVGLSKANLEYCIRIFKEAVK